MEPKQEAKKAACDVKAKLVKLAGGTAAHLPPPVAGESLNRPDESKLSSVRFLLSPLVVLRTPCADCISVPQKCRLDTKIRRND